MRRTIEKLWLLPLVPAVVVVLTFASVMASMFPLPYYLGLTIPYLVVLNVALVIFIAVRYKNQFLKACAVSILSMGLAYLWLIQTA